MNTNEDPPSEPARDLQPPRDDRRMRAPVANGRKVSTQADDRLADARLVAQLTLQQAKRARQRIGKAQATAEQLAAITGHKPSPVPEVTQPNPRAQLEPQPNKAEKRVSSRLAAGLRALIPCIPQQREPRDPTPNLRGKSSELTKNRGL
jgi:hypothetical protein